MGLKLFVEYVPISDIEAKNLKEDQSWNCSFPPDADIATLVDALITINGPLQSFFCYLAEEEG